MRGLVVGGHSGIGEAFLDYVGGWLDGRPMPTQRVDMQTDWLVPDRFELDVRNPASVAGFIGVQTEPFDFLVYSAGVDRLDWLGQTDFVSLMEVYQVNVFGFIYLLDTLVLTQPEHPMRIVLVGSDAAERPMRTSTGYCSSKAAAHMAVRTAARELGSKGWRLNVVAPGMTDETGMQEYVDDRVQAIRGWTYEGMRSYEATQEVVPGRINKVEVADVIHSTLIGPDHLNGSIITLNGGR